MLFSEPEDEGDVYKVPNPDDDHGQACSRPPAVLLLTNIVSALDVQAIPVLLASDPVDGFEALVPNPDDDHGYTSKLLPPSLIAAT